MDSQLREEIAVIAARYPSSRSALLPALDLVQRRGRGHLEAGDLKDVAGVLNLPLSQVYDSASYYTMFNLEPVGKYHLQVDTNLPALLAGADELLAHLERRLGIRAGQTTPDGCFTLSTVEDLGSCGTCPVIQVNQDRLYENVTTARADELIDSLRRDAYPAWKVESYWGSECRILLKRRGKPNSTALAGYLADGGYAALEKALSKTPAELVAIIKDAMLRGRGGAGFPAGVKASFLPKDSKKPVYLICNADEGEPGTFKDRQIMEYDPHLLIESMAIMGYGIGARLGFIYIRGEFFWIADILERAVKEAREAGKLGKNILGRGVEFDVIVHRGAGAYVCGEETALIESLEGKRGNPRPRPPFPAQAGLYGCPTIVNNVETLVNLPFIVTEGAAAYRKIGTSNNFGPKLYGISGHVHRPGVYEYPLGTPLTTLLEAAGGVKGRLKAVIVGGLSTPILTADEARDLKMDYDSCLKHGTMLGSGGIIAMNETVKMPEMALRAIEFYAHESCGQCTPCRQGSAAIVELLRDLVAGRGKRGDLDTILWLCATIKGSTLCPTGEAFAAPVDAMMRKFRSEFEARIS
jgi:NADH-quinone oxidoreductase F subunit